MKTFKFLMPFMLAVLGIAGCNTDDLRNDIDELKNRVESLEAQVSAFNENINALKVLIDGKLTIQEVKEENGVYTLLLSNEQTIKLKQGEDFSAPQEPEVTIKNGNWWVNGRDTGCSVSGVVPTFRIDNGYWQFKFDGDWKNVKDANGNDVRAVSDGTQTGNSFFESVKYDEPKGVLIIELKENGKSLSLPVVQNLKCAIDKASLKNGNTLVVGYGKTAELPVTINGDNAFVTAPSGWIATLSEPDTDGKATLTVKAPAKADASTMSRATADNSKDLTVQVNKGVNWAVDKIQVEAGEVIESYYELFDSDQTIEIAGVELKKTDWENVTGFSIKQIKSSGNGSDDNKITQNGIYFLEAGAEAVYTYTGAVTNLFIIRDNSIDNTAKLVMTDNNYVKLNNNTDPINSKFVCEGLNLDATAMTNYQVTANGKFGQIVFSNCNINLTTEKAFIYVSNKVTDREFDKIIIENCKFDWTNRTQDNGFQLCNLQTTSIKSSISLVNNVFYAKGQDVKLQIFNFLQKDIPYVEMKNNTFVNAVPSTDGYIKCKSVTSINIQNNLFYSTNYSSNQLLFRYDNDNADGATISTTGTVSNNFGNKGGKNWKLFYSNNVVEGGTQIDNTKETIFSNMDYDKVIFTPIDELSGCGATID